ncbi:sulfotransferase family protein [Aquabacterium sp.]|uniref:sulfotransferase family protein n=1 Tax=Aquabacterium sp. TaxID=1872578 RepID=UPI003BB1004F
MKKRQVVLIGGAMRSGTTVIHRALCTGENTNPYISESWFLLDVMRMYKWNLTRYDVRNADQFGSMENFREVVFDNYRKYVMLISAKYNDPEVMVLKHPELTRYFNDISDYFEDWKFVVIVRDPRDVIASIKRVQKRHQESGLRTPQTELRSIADFCREYMSYYSSVDFARLKGRYIFLKYEDFVMNSTDQLTKVAMFTGARYDAGRVLKFSEDHQKAANFDKEKRLDDKFAGAFWSDMYTKDISDASIGSYKADLTEDQIVEIQQRVGDFGRRFGYW